MFFLSLIQPHMHLPNPFLCSTYNLLMNSELAEVLQNLGFKRSRGQVWMQKNYEFLSSFINTIHQKSTITKEAS
jgi:hypothetical protein